MNQPWIIAASNRGWHVRDLERAFAARCAPCIVAPFASLLGDHQGTDPLLRRAAGVMVRTIPGGTLEQVVLRMDLLHLAAESGLRVMNSPRALEGCVDKFLTTARLGRAGLPVPPTLCCQTSAQAMEAFDGLGGDIVFKPLFGSEGRGMVRVTDRESAWRVATTLERLGAALYLQAFVRHPGWDLRVFTLAGRVLTAMTRHGGQDWRTNVAQGAIARPATPAAEAASLALEAASLMGATMAGVDLLIDGQGKWWIIEVNAVPGWRGLTEATGLDVAAALVDHALGNKP
ncbi:MAG: RimK family alpha-L-glutamate ligase [Planctomycetota bacterium]|nr:RimK family alpha-L-glutamate ligase [Planctomycetota bacterium]